MPARKPRRPARGTKILRPGVTRHDGIYQENDGSASDVLDGSGVRRRRTQRLSSQEEGVLYTVKVAQRSPIAMTGTSPPPQSGDVESRQTEPQQYTISKKEKKNNTFTNFFRSFGIELGGLEDVDSHLYKPSKPLMIYLNWTFFASFTAVFFSFLAIFIVLCILFAGLLALAGEIQPDCIVVSGEDYGHSQITKFGDAFALSWTTFTTVGYGNTYPATGSDLETNTKTHQCSGVVFLCTLEAFSGLIYAGMCAAILFGKVNRVQSHAHLTFANVVCLEYEFDNVQLVDDDSSDSDCEESDEEEDIKEEKSDKDTVVRFVKAGRRETLTRQMHKDNVREQFRGCPVLKFQVVNDLCNKAGGEIVDAVMKVVGIKMKRYSGKITHSQYVRVNLVDYEHPFFGRVWHGVHILDGSSPLLKSHAKERINANGGRWPDNWLGRPCQIRRKLDFHRLIVTVSGVSNISASTVHAYKRYKFEDVIIGFDFAPLVYENEESNKVEVDLGLVNDVVEHQKGHGEDLKGGRRSSESSINFTRGSSSIFHQSTRQPPPNISMFDDTQN